MCVCMCGIPARVPPWRGLCGGVPTPLWGTVRGACGTVLAAGVMQRNPCLISGAVPAECPTYPLPVLRLEYHSRKEGSLWQYQWIPSIQERLVCVKESLREYFCGCGVKYLHGVGKQKKFFVSMTSD